MSWLVRVLQAPTKEFNLSLVLGLCVITMGLLSMALLWQAQIIANQRDVIQWLETLKFGA
ncbi:MAG TPA: hypothetical protein VOA64_11225 [Candidatus Dormibacteraeota bacterium]|nr:hypothetical protein [Candidatus Dormibacteraeota bacterium]